MAVDAVEDDPLPVQLHHAVPQPKAAEAGLIGHRLLDGAGGVPQSQSDGVEGGVAVVPLADAGQADRQAIDKTAAVRAQGHGGVPEDGPAGGGHGAVEGTALQAGPFGGAQAQAGGQGAGGVVGFEAGLEPQVLDVQRGLGVEVHGAEDAEEAEEVLIFQPAARAVLVDLHAQAVLAGLQEGGQVEVGGGEAVLAVAHEMAVAPAVKGPFHALEGDADPLALQRLVQGEGLDVAAHRGVVPGDVGRAEGVPAVPGVHGVDVLDLAVALHLDVAGHGDLVKAVEAGVRLPETGRTGGGAGAVGKAPGAVQTLAQIARFGVPGVVRVGVQPVDRKDPRVLQPFQFGVGSVHEDDLLAKLCKMRRMRGKNYLNCTVRPARCQRENRRGRIEECCEFDFMYINIYELKKELYGLEWSAK